MGLARRRTAHLVRLCPSHPCRIGTWYQKGKWRRRDGSLLEGLELGQRHDGDAGAGWQTAV